MIPLFICSVLALAVILERTISLRRNSVIKPELIYIINVIKGPKDIQAVSNRCDIIKGPFSNIIKRTISNIHLSREEKVMDIEAAGRQESRNLERMLIVLEVVTAISPLLGLLGTVWGVMRAFLAMGVKGWASLAVVGPGRRAGRSRLLRRCPRSSGRCGCDGRVARARRDPRRRSHR